MSEIDITNPLDGPTPSDPSTQYQTVLTEYLNWTADPSEDKDIRPLSRAAKNYLRTGLRSIPMSHLAPCIAILYFRNVEYDSPFWIPPFMKLWIRALKYLVFRGRPMWNDFHMTLWSLSRDARYVYQLHHHLRRANPIQKYTGQWMVNSVCKQDPEFEYCWQKAIQQWGEVFDPPTTAQEAFL